MAFREDRYPSFSAPATLERKRTQSWFASAKEMFMKPWQRKKQAKRVRRPHKPHPPLPATAIKETGTSSLTSFDEYQNNPFRQGFPNFQNRLAPIGGSPHLGGKSPLLGGGLGGAQSRPAGNDLIDGGVVEGKGANFQLPEGSQPIRPSLKNVFPMFDSVAKAAAPSAVNSASKTEDAPKTIDKPKLAPPSAPRAIPAITADVDEATPPTSDLPRRHSTPATPTSNFLKAVSLDERRASASSDTTADKKTRQERRDRRASVTRDLPLLPKRGQDPLQPSPLSSPGSPPNNAPLGISPYSEYTGPPQKVMLDASDTSPRPPVGPGGGGALQGSFAYPPMWPQQPHQQLQDLEEELEEDGEGDGEEGKVGRVDEVGAGQWAEFKPQVRLPSSPTDQGPPNKGKDQGGPSKGFGRLQELMSSKRKGKNAEPANVKPPRVKSEKEKGKDDEEDPEIRGFDDFFMY